MLIYSIQIAIVAIVYILVLPDQQPFDRWFRFGNDKFRNTLIYKPLWDCEKCFAGQLSLWIFILVHVEHYHFIDVSHLAYAVGKGIYFICQTIIITIILSKLFLQLTEK